MKIALIGYGKMGHLIAEVAQARGHEIVCIIDAGDDDKYSSPAFHSAAVAIEFSVPAAAYGNCRRAWDEGLPVVSGTTGWIDEHRAEVERACHDEGKTLFWAANFSVGVALFSAVNRYLARLMNAFPQYDVHEDETHHIHKLDHPSGTAITLAEQVVAALDRKTGWQKGTLTQPDGQVVAPATTDSDKVTINSVRRGEVPGIHSIVYDSPEDCLTLTHSAHSRRGFALGAVLAAEFTATHHGLLTIDDMITF